MESVEFIYSCADCGFQTIDEFLLDDHLESYRSNRMPNGPNIIHEIFPNAREQFSINSLIVLIVLIVIQVSFRSHFGAKV